MLYVVAPADAHHDLLLRLVCVRPLLWDEEALRVDIAAVTSEVKADEVLVLLEGLGNDASVLEVNLVKGQIDMNQLGVDKDERRY